MRKSFRCIAQTSLAAVVVAGGIAVTTAAPASAGTAKCNLSIVEGPTASTEYLRIKCTQTDPFDYPQIVEAWGDDDPFADDHLKTLYPVNYYPMYLPINDSVLNEDTGFGDEIYAKVVFRTPLGGRYVVKTNVVDGYWS